MEFRRAVTTLVLLLAGAFVLSACAAKAVPPDNPAVVAAKGYAHALPSVLAGGDARTLAPYATDSQIERVARYKMLLRGERGRLLESRIGRWRPVSVAADGDAMMVTVEETWVTRGVEAETGEPLEEPVTQTSSVTYRVVEVDGTWLVDDLEESAVE